jgi:pimeloyl-ACP methyl ester carboxylesterase
MTIKTHQVTSFDGCPITYYTVGEVGPWLVIANGHGGNLDIWTPIFERLAGRVRILIWDYRGHYRSGRPGTVPSIDDHCADLDAVLDAEGLKYFALMGWSLGVQVALETYARDATRVGALFLMHGAHDRLIKRIYGGRLSPVLGPVVRLAAAAEPYTQPLLSRTLKAAVKSPLGGPAFRALRFVKRTDEHFLGLAMGVLGLDLSQYLRVALRATEHRTEEWLSEIEVPVVITAGKGDVLTPPKEIKRAFERIPNATYHELDGGHFPTVEEPDLIAELMYRTAQLSRQS